MTDLLSVEDIKKAVGAFAGEQRAPPFPQPSPLIHAPRPCAHTAGGPPQRPSVRAPRRAPAGRRGGGPRHFSNSIRAGLGAGREAGRPARATETCWRQRLGGGTARIDWGPGPKPKTGGRRLDSLVPVGTRDFPCKTGGRNCRHTRLPSDPFPRPPFRQDFSCPAAVAEAGPTTVRTPIPRRRAR